MRILVVGDSNIFRKRVFHALKQMNTTVSLVTRQLKSDRSYDSFERVWFSLDSALAENYSLVYISTINSEHFSMALKCLRANQHVIVEKPLALSASEVSILLNEAECRNLFLGQSSVWRFHKMYQNLPEYLDNIIEVEASFKIPALDDENFRNKQDKGGGVFWDMAVYFFESLLIHPHWKELVSGEVCFENSFTKLNVRMSSQPYSYCGSFEFNSSYVNQLKIKGLDFQLFYPRAFTLGNENIGEVFIEREGKEEMISVKDNSMYQNYFYFVQRSISGCDYKKSYEDVKKFRELLIRFKK